MNNFRGFDRANELYCVQRQNEQLKLETIELYAKILCVIISIDISHISFCIHDINLPHYVAFGRQAQALLALLTVSPTQALGTQVGNAVTLV